MARGSWHNIIIEENFTGPHDPVTNTAVPRDLGQFRIVGQGIAEIDSGVPALDVDGLGGVVQLTTTDENQHCCGIETSTMFDVALMGPIIAEARVRLAALTNKTMFMGFTDIAIANYVPSIEVDMLSGSATTITKVASDYCGFIMSSGLTSSSEWHGVYNGGTTTGPTDSNAMDLNVNASAGDWVLLRLEIQQNGNVTWFVDGAQKQFVITAVSTSVDLKFFLAVEAKSAAVTTMDVDYVRIWSTRDWTV